jgi:hypothetical protein
MIDWNPTYKLNHYQQDFLDSTARFPCELTGVGTGKTFALLLKAWNHCTANPNALGMIVRKELTDLKDSTIKDFNTYFGTDLPPSKTQHKFDNGAELLFRHGNVNDVEALKNINLSFAGIEQAEEYDDDTVFNFLRDRLRRQGVNLRQLAVIANANGHNWIVDKWVKQATEVEDYDQYVIINGRRINTGEMFYRHKNFECWTANSFANAHNLPLDTIADWLEMEQDAPNHFKQMIMNSFDDIDAFDILLTTEEIQRALHQEFLYDACNYNKNIMSVDIASMGKDKCVAINLTQRGPIHWEENIFDSWGHLGLMETVGKILELRRKWKPDILVVDADGMGEGVYSRIKENGIECVGYRGGRILQNMKRPDRFTTKSTEDAFFLKEELVQDGRIKLLPEVVPDLQIVRYTFSSDGGKIGLVPKKQLPRSPDHFDAVKMGAAQVDKVMVNQFRQNNRGAQKIIPANPMTFLGR